MSRRERPRHARRAEQRELAARRPKPVARPRLPRASRASVAVPVAVGLLTLIAFVNAAPPVAVHDDKFFVPSVFHLDAQSVANLFREDAWGAAGAPAGRAPPLLLLALAVGRALRGQGLRPARSAHTVGRLPGPLGLP